MRKEKPDVKQAIETLLFITDEPLGVGKIAQAVGVREKDREKVVSFVTDIQREYEERGGPLQVLEVANGYQMATRPQFAAVVRRLFKDKMVMRLSKPALETLSIVAYRQPLTRAEIEEIRGVEVIAALETLLEKGLVRVVGRKETVGRPLLYGTTMEFLRHFGLRSLGDLPPIDSFAPPPDPDAEPIPPEAAEAGVPVETAVESAPVSETGLSEGGVEEPPAAQAPTVEERSAEDPPSVEVPPEKPSEEGGS